jgi:DNA-binding PadR family transcriptional regulator
VDRIEEMVPLAPHMFLILLALHGGPLHGYGIKKAVRERSGGRVDLDPGGLYRLVARLEARGVVRAAEAPVDAPEDDRRRLFHALTPAGERLLKLEARRLASLVDSADVAALIHEAGA